MHTEIRAQRSTIRFSSIQNLKGKLPLNRNNLELVGNKSKTQPTNYYHDEINVITICFIKITLKPDDSNKVNEEEQMLEN